MLTLNRIEKVLFLLLLFSIPFQTRVFLWSAGVVEGFNEWQSVFLYATDILIVLLFVVWLWQERRRLFLSRAAVGSFQRLAATASRLAAPRQARGPSPPALREPLSSKVIVSLLLVLFFGVALISIFFAVHGVIGVYRFVKLVEFVGLFFYVGRIMPRIRFSHLMLIFVASGLVQSFIAIGQFSLQRSLGLKLLGESPLVVSNPTVAHIVTSGGTYIRAYGTLPSPNVLAAFLSIAILFLLYWYISRRPSKSFFSLPIDGFMLVSLVLLVFVLFLTFSRGVLLAFFVSSVLFFGLLLFSQKRKATLWALGFFITAHILVVGLMWPELFSRFTASNPTNDVAVTERLFFNEVAYETIAIRPWSGVGLGNFTFFYRDFFPGLPDHLYQPVHNIFLLVGAEMGIVALALFMIFFIKMLGTRVAHFLARDSKQGEHALFVAVLTFIFLSGFIDHYYLTIQQGSLLFWIVLGMAYYKVGA